jgi:hypothetical protein
MYGKSNWYGREVEGRLADVETVFVRGKVPDNFKEYPHIYFTTEYIEMAVQCSDDVWDTIHSILETRQFVTIEANAWTLDKIPMSIFNRVHIIYRIADPNVAKLKQTDTLSVDAGWYRVHQITKCNMMEINPDDYKFDRIEE